MQSTSAGTDTRLPVSLLTGFLGSGKTTLLNRLLQHERMANTAVVINEFGEIGLDQLFVERSDGEVTVLTNGCLCCDVQGDLEAVIGTLFGRSHRGELPPFDRMVIETTGLADPAPIMQMLLAQPLIADNFRLDAVITTVDVLHARRAVREHPEAVKQIALADRFVLTKTDLADNETIAAATAMLGTMNRNAVILRAIDEPDPAMLFGADHSALDIALAPRAHDHLHDIETFVLRAERPLDWRAFSRWLTALKIRHADALLRVKGVLALTGDDRPVAIHGVHHVFHPPVRLRAWPAGDTRQSRIVFITKGLAYETVEASWRAHLELEHAT